MGWLDRIENTAFTITTGDGKLYAPLWKNPSETKKEFNTAIYDFIGLPGALIDRKTVRARSFPLEFYFTGDDNIEQAELFDQSANDRRAWTVFHPMYGTIYGQPTNIGRDDSNLNATKFNVEFWETISDKTPVSNISITDVMEGNVTQLATVSPLNYTSKVHLKPADVNTVTDSITRINARIAKILDTGSYSEYTTLKNTAFAAVDNLLTVPETAITGIYNMILLPAQFAVSLTARMSLLSALYSDVKAIPQTLGDNLATLTSALGLRNNKAYFESVGGAVIASICNAMVNPIAGDLLTRTAIVNASAILAQLYNDYLQALDNAYVPVTDTVNSFSPSTETQALLQICVVTTIANLADLALNAKQERTVTLEHDSNLILLTHKYIGLDADDMNLETFRQINGIKNSRLFGVKKGSLIKYYA